MQKYRNCFQMVMQIIEKSDEQQRKEEFKLVMEEGYFKNSAEQEKQAIVAAKISQIIKLIGVGSGSQELIDIIEAQMIKQQEVKRLV